MKLSIIVPVYNGEKYLEECLTSIVDELSSDMELIIVNDGSNDSSLKICQKFTYNTNVQIFTNDNHGVSYSRNFGIDKAKGDYVCFVDSDDILCKNWSKNVFDAITNNSDFILFLSGIDNNMEKEKMLEYIFKVDNKFQWISTPWSKLFKREILNKYNIRFKEDVINGEDMLFNAEVVLSTNRISYIDSSIYNYRINPLSVTKTFKSKIFNSDQIFLKNIECIFEQHKLSCSKFYNHCLENAIIMFVDKISLLNRTERSNYYYIFSEEPYADFISNNINFINKFNKIIIKQIKQKRIDLAIKIFLIKKKLKKIIKRDIKEEYIIKV